MKRHQVPSSSSLLQFTSHGFPRCLLIRRAPRFWAVRVPGNVDYEENSPQQCGATATVNRARSDAAKRRTAAETSCLIRSRLCVSVIAMLTQLLSFGLASGQVLTHGPVVGGVTASEAKVFLRTNQSATVAVCYGTDPTLVAYQVSDTFTTTITSDFTKTIPLANLTPETTYYLNVLVNGIPQLDAPPYPSFTVFPPPGSARDFKFVVLSDFLTIPSLHESVQTFGSAAALVPAFVFIGGDFDHRNPVTLAAKRTMFHDLYDPNTPFMSDFVPLILRQFPIIHQWDDHDAGLNNLDKNYPDWDLSQQAFQENIPTYTLPSVSPGIWQKFSYAQADLFVLDCRSQRDPENDPDNADKSMLDGNALGAPGQLQWLKDGLLASTAAWKIIFSSVLANPSTKIPDAWGGYQTEWMALKEFINSNNIHNIVIISGDLHQASIDNGTQAGFPEMCAPQANASRAGYCATSGFPGDWSEGYYDDSCAGFGLVTVSQNPDRLTLQTADQYGTIHLSYVVNAAQPTPTPTPTPIPPSITSQPASKTVGLGQTARFSVTATGAAPLNYQWRKNASNITGATKPSYTTPPATRLDNGTLFSVVVSNGGGSVTSNNATLTVNSPPMITIQPNDATVKAGQTAKFSARAIGTSPLVYQWRKNGQDIAGAIKSFYSTPPTTLADDGTVYCVLVTNSLGAVTSNSATLTVN